jgi:hypothetical protein
MNDRDFQTNPDYPATNRVLRYVVGNSTSSSDENGNIPDHYPILHFRASTLRLTRLLSSESPMVFNGSLMVLDLKM